MIKVNGEDLGEGSFWTLHGYMISKSSDAAFYRIARITDFAIMAMVYVCDMWDLPDAVQAVKADMAKRKVAV